MTFGIRWLAALGRVPASNARVGRKARAPVVVIEAFARRVNRLELISLAGMSVVASSPRDPGIARAILARPKPSSDDLERQQGR